MNDNERTTHLVTTDANGFGDLSPVAAPNTIYQVSISEDKTVITLTPILTREAKNKA